MSDLNERESLRPVLTGSEGKHNFRLDMSESDLLGENYAYDRPVSPFRADGEIDGLASLQKNQYMDNHGQSPREHDSPTAAFLKMHIPTTPSPAELALSALQYLPYPLMVLNDLKTLVLANDSMGRLLGIDDQEDDRMSDDGFAADRLQGQTLSQMGIDLLEEGRPVWVTWESFLDSIADEGLPAQDSSQALNPDLDEGEITPTAGKSQFVGRKPLHNKSTVHDAVVEVIISPADVSTACFANGVNKCGVGDHTFAKMIITVWEIEDERYFTLTFTNTNPAEKSYVKTQAQTRQITKTIPRSEAMRSGSSSSSNSGKRSSPSSVSSNSGRSSWNGSRGGSSKASAITSPTATSMSGSPFPPFGPPSRANTSSTPSTLQKVLLMKEALLDNTEIPIVAMWHDESIAIPNKAARRLFHPTADPGNFNNPSELLSKWHLWDETFSRTLEASEYPITELIRTQTPFLSRKIGLYDPDNGNKIVLDCVGEALTDDDTGEFLAGILTCKDITSVMEEMTEIKESNEERFQVICDSLPQMLWTTTPEGMHDWFSQRWYDYTGLTEEVSLGMGWELPFHPEDMTATGRRWAHSLATGEPYHTEYRCRSKDGEWRWMLGRALPLRNKQTGAIERWFGSCTDIHEAVESRFNARRMRQQLLSVISHAQVTLFAVDRDRNLTLLEGSFIWDVESEEISNDGSASTGNGKLSKGEEYLGRNIYEVYFSLNHGPAHDQDIPPSLKAIEDILTGKKMEDVYEHTIDSRAYRTQFLPVLGKKGVGGQVNDAFIDGVIGVSIDITEMKNKEQSLREQEKENTRLLANEAAAKEASRLKSQFLANMSHEIRTPIAGVIGMAELLADTELDEEQRECAENIQRSANGLLTVINDILDFSKVESGRLDIEEVQFSLSVVVRDVSKMLSFAAERKNLIFESDIAVGLDRDLIVMGDPGRVRQIITNLLTNSIKFTSEGHVKFSVLKARETSEIYEVKFVVEDTGIGIEEEVRKRLFKPFSQADSSTARRFGGTGLGLTISKNLVDLMHGSISLDSSLGNGTIATFSIPFNKPQFVDGALIDLGSIPDRLQSEMSVSCNSSEYEQACGTPTRQRLSSTQANRSKFNMTPPAEPVLSPAERSKINILLVEDNPINQQIALKTIRKLGFNVTAVWNGKEALEYLLATDEEEAQHPKPDIILMDVQMPIIDGYRATHVIRHHSPYRLTTKHIPIVAMTASAIQGDKEKCQRAGMDDYLAKPVKGKTLEKMIVKWAISRRTSDTPGCDDYESSECFDSGEHDCRAGNVPKIGSGGNTTSISSPVTEVPTALPRPTMSERQASHRLTLPGTESEGDREVRRNEAEEKALFLRDEKMVGAAGGSGEGLVPHVDTRSMGQMLTMENVGKLQQEQEGDTSNWIALKRESSNESTEQIMETNDERRKKPVRAEMKWHDSSRTVTDHER